LENSTRIYALLALSEDGQQILIMTSELNSEFQNALKSRFDKSAQLLQRITISLEHFKERNAKLNELIPENKNKEGLVGCGSALCHFFNEKKLPIIPFQLEAPDSDRYFKPI
jgi:hypothetical protein